MASIAEMVAGREPQTAAQELVFEGNRLTFEGFGPKGARLLRIDFDQGADEPLRQALAIDRFYQPQAVMFVFDGGRPRLAVVAGQEESWEHLYIKHGTEEVWNGIGHADIPDPTPYKDKEFRYMLYPYIHIVRTHFNDLGIKVSSRDQRLPSHPYENREGRGYWLYGFVHRVRIAKQRNTLILTGNPTFFS